MIRANVDVLITNLGNMNNKCGDLIHFLDRLKVAENIVALTDEQKLSIVAQVNAYGGDIQSIYNTMASVFAATEPIVEG